MKVINLIGGPGSGKSTTAAGLFNLMKLEGIKCELVVEYAKEIVYEGRKTDDQLYILAQQNRRLRRLEKHVDYVITDSPLLLSIIYASTYPSSLHQLVMDLYWQYDNKLFYLKRNKPYEKYGRTQTLEEAVDLDKSIKKMLKKRKIPYEEILGDKDAPVEIFDKLFEIK
jgi:nicotinamide riboside kinase